MIRLNCIVEVAEAQSREEALEILDAFREAVLPSEEYGLTIYELRPPSWRADSTRLGASGGTK